MRKSSVIARKNPRRITNLVRKSPKPILAWDSLFLQVVKNHPPAALRFSGEKSLIDESTKPLIDLWRLKAKVDFRNKLGPYGKC